MSYVGYFEANKEYIIEKYCVNKSAPQLKCNGKCHLSKKLTSITITTSTESYESQFKAMLSSFKNIFTPFYYYSVSTDLELVNINNYSKLTYYLLPKKYVFYPSLVSPPPRV